VSLKSAYTPGSWVVIDESLISFRGRVNTRQYISGKALKYGIKLYKLCASTRTLGGIKYISATWPRTDIYAFGVCCPAAFKALYSAGINYLCR
jgi:hypothetical protein